MTKKTLKMDGTHMEYITMNHKELEQAKVFELVNQGLITQAEAAARLKITDRWVRKKIKRYNKSGELGLIHRGRGKLSSKRWDPEKEKFLIELLDSKWHGFGPTFASEKLEEIHEIKVSREVVRQAMIRAGLWQPKQKRVKHRKRRERKPMFGIMIQLDGSPHDWLEGRAGKCTLLVFIDDATSQILWLEFVESESVEAIMRATKNYIEKYGIPRSFYNDHGSVFHVNLNNAEGDKKTQWERACKQLCIEIIHAHSPQAKGRVERCNQTMQDRLIKELRLAGIYSIEAANKFLHISSFIVNHNAKFSVKAAQKGDAHRDHRQYNLDDIFSIYETRILGNDFTITFNKRIFQLHNQQRTIIRPKNEITVKTQLDGTLKLWIRKTELFFSEINAYPAKIIKEKTMPNHIPHKPNRNSQRWAFGLPSLRRVGEAGQTGHGGHF